MSPSAARVSAHVVIAGGGFAGLETLLALRAMADDRLPVALIAPNSSFYFRPAATVEAFEDDTPRSYSLEEIAADLGATLLRGRLESVGAERQYVRLSCGARLNYDRLVLAIGTRARARIAGALTFRDQRDVPLFRGLLADLEAGSARRLVFALPPAPTYPVPLYELALLSAGHARRYGIEAEIPLVSSEVSPLDQFGDKPTSLVAEVLDECGVTFVGGEAGRGPPRRTARARLRRGHRGRSGHRGAAAARSADHRRADELLRLRAHGCRRPRGGPSQHVSAAGDIPAFPVKQAGLATQQADRIAQRILESVGVATPELRRSRILQAQLIGGEQPLFLRAELEDRGRTTSASLAHHLPSGDEAHDKVFVRYLKPYLRAIRQRADLPVSV